MSEVPSDARDVLERARLCYICVNTARGPHVTPMVFAWSGGRIWITTSRGSLKSRAWSNDDRVAGLARHDGRTAVVRGRVRSYDALDPDTWIGAAIAAPSLAAASLRFGAKNTRFFAGYAIDARHVPLAWTPPGRVFAGLDPARGALIAGATLRSSWGGWPRSEAAGPEAFRARTRGSDPLAALPPDVAVRLGRLDPDAALGIEGSGGPAVLPAGWIATAADLYAVVPAEVASLAGGGLDGRVALSTDRASQWRARDMMGAMVQGDATAFALDELSSGRRSAARLVAAVGVEPSAAVVVRIVPKRLVWWRGWSAGATSTRSPRPKNGEATA